jgi:hypothetical protein
VPTTAGTQQQHGGCQQQQGAINVRDASRTIDNSNASYSMEAMQQQQERQNSKKVRKSRNASNNKLATAGTPSITLLAYLRYILYVPDPLLRRLLTLRSISCKKNDVTKLNST